MSNKVSASVIHHKDFTISFLFQGIDEQGVINFALKHGNAIESKYGIHFSARSEESINVCLVNPNEIIIRPLLADGKTAKSKATFDTHVGNCIKSAVKEFVTLYNEKNIYQGAAKSPPPLKKVNKPLFNDNQENILDHLKIFFHLSDAQELQIRQSLEGFAPPRKFEDGVYYVHSSGKYRYLGVSQPDKTVRLLNISKGGTVSSLNNDPHYALTAGIVKRET